MDCCCYLMDFNAIASVLFSAVEGIVGCFDQGVGII